MVLAVWSAIFYRLFSPVENQPTKQPPAAINAPLLDVEMSEDDSLWVDYPDPFLDEQEESIAFQDDFETAPYIASEEIAYMDWSQVRYLGSVRAADGKKTVILLNINGREFMLKPGDSVDGYTVLVERKNAIVISYQGQTNTIYLKGGTTGSEEP